MRASVSLWPQPRCWTRCIASSASGPKLANVQEVRVAYEQDAARKVELLHGLAELFELQLDNPPAAFEAYGRSLAFEPANENTQAALERLAEQLGSWTEVTRLYDAGVEQLKEAPAMPDVQLALRSAQIYEIQVENIDAAIARYRSWWTPIRPTRRRSRRSTASTSPPSRWSELAEILRKEIEIAPTPDDMLNTQFRLGQVLQARLSRVGDAVGQYRDILAAAPSISRPCARSRRCLRTGRCRWRSARCSSLCTACRAPGTRLIGVHEVQLSHQADQAERVAMMHRVAEIAEDKAGDSRLAFLWMQRALLEEPQNEHTDSEVERLARVTGGWEVLANTYADVVSNGVSSGRKVTLGRKLARIYETS